MGFFKKTNEFAYYRAASINYTSYEADGLDTSSIITKIVTESPQSRKKPLLDFDDQNFEEFASYFNKLTHEQAKFAICNMVVFGVRQNVNISDFNDETMNQFIENAIEQSKS